MRNKSDRAGSLILCLFSLLFSTAAHATPPTKIDLEYDKEKQILLADIAHISDKADEHYIRKIILQVNNDNPQIFNYRKQVKPNKFEVKLPLELQPGDVVKLKAQCSQGGDLEASLAIPEEDEGAQGKKTTSLPLIIRPK